MIERKTINYSVVSAYEKIEGGIKKAVVTIEGVDGLRYQGKVYSYIGEDSAQNYALAQRNAVLNMVKNMEGEFYYGH